MLHKKLTHLNLRKKARREADHRKGKAGDPGARGLLDQPQDTPSLDHLWQIRWGDGRVRGPRGFTGVNERLNMKFLEGKKIERPDLVIKGGIGLQLEPNACYVCPSPEIYA